MLPLSRKESEYFKEKFRAIRDRQHETVEGTMTDYVYDVMQRINQLDDFERLCQELVSYLRKYHTTILGVAIELANEYVRQFVNPVFITGGVIDISHWLNREIKEYETRSRIAAKELGIDQCPYGIETQLKYLGYLSLMPEEILYNTIDETKFEQYKLKLRKPIKLIKPLSEMDLPKIE